MKNLFKLSFLSLFGVLMAFGALAQDDRRTEASDPDDGNTPLDDIVEKRLMKERMVLQWDHVREADIFWERRVWRVIDTREKMNKTFSYPKNPLISIILDAAKNGEINLYDQMTDDFTLEVGSSDVEDILSKADTIVSYDEETYEEITKVVRNDFNPEDVKRYRIKEIWFFDEESSTLRVRILGIAPLKEVFDDNGNFRYEQPMFWAYYPQLREVLAKEQAFNPLNDASLISWEDLMEMRFFSSYVYKASNVYDRRLQDYLSGVDLLLEADKIKNEIFNFEHDLWSY